MINSLAHQIKLLLHFLKSYWFLVAVAMGIGYMATPRMELIVDDFLSDVYQKGLDKREQLQIKRIDSLNTIQLLKLDSVNKLANSILLNKMINKLDSNTTLMVSLSDKAVINRLNKMLTDTIPYYEEGREVGFYLIYLTPDLKPIVNKYNSILNYKAK